MNAIIDWNACGYHSIWTQLYIMSNKAYHGEPQNESHDIHLSEKKNFFWGDETQKNSICTLEEKLMNLIHNFFSTFPHDTNHRIFWAYW